MNDFKLDPRLATDCKLLTKLDFSQVLLMDNSLIPWFILVPETNEVEIIDLSESKQTALPRNSIHIKIYKTKL